MQVTDLSRMTFQEEGGSSDTVRATIDGHSYMMSYPSVLGLGLPGVTSAGSWDLVEFGVYGDDGQAPNVNLSPGTSIVTQILTEPPQNTAACTKSSIANTGETNNLSLECCLAVGGVSPGITFEQSNSPGQSCSICGAEGQACCSIINGTTSLCASSSDVCYSQTCVHCGGDDEPCCPGLLIPCSSGEVCQSNGTCGPLNVLTPVPDSATIQYDDGSTGGNSTTVYFEPRGYWTGYYADTSPFLTFKVIDSPTGAYPVGVMPAGINAPTITNSPPYVIVDFSATYVPGLVFNPGAYVFQIQGTLGTSPAAFTAITTFTLNVDPCQATLTCGGFGYTCGLLDNGCGTTLTCEPGCSATQFCTAGSCYNCAERACPDREYLDLNTCACKSCPCGTTALIDGHYLCRICTPQAGPLPWWNGDLWDFPYTGLTPVAPVQALLQEGNTVSIGAGFSASALALLGGVASGSAQMILGDDVFSVPLGAQPGAVFVQPNTTSLIGALAQVGGIVNTPTTTGIAPSNPVDPPEVVSFDASDGTLFALQVTGTTATLDTVNVSAALQGVVSTGSTAVVGVIPSKPLAMLWDVFTRSLFVMDSIEDGHAGRGRLRLLTLDPVSGASSLLWQTTQGCDFPDKVLMSVGLQQEISVGLVGVPAHDHSEILLLAASGKPLFARDVHGRFIGPPHAVPTGVDLAFETHDPALLVDFEQLPQAKLDTGLCGGTWLRDNADLRQPSPSVLSEAEANCRHGQ